MMLSRILFITVLVAMITIAGCAPQAPRASEAGVYDIGKLRVTLDNGWYEQRGAELPDTQARSKTWSREGLEHDRLFITGGVDDGEPVFDARDYTGLPVFRSNMSAAEVADFAAQSLQRVLWNGSASHLGIAGGFVEEGHLYLTIYLAESPGYFERHRQAAQAVIDSSVPTMKTIRRP